jgi:hypothetical protein
VTDHIALSDDQIMTTLREVVAERPDYVYAAPEHQVDPGNISRFYVHVDEDGGNERPGCLVSVVLNRLGVPLEDLARREGNGAYTVARSLAGVSTRIASALSEAQDAQDSGATWACALERAESWVPDKVLI